MKWMGKRRRQRREDSWKRTVNRRGDNLYRRVADVIVFSVPLAVVCLVANVIMRMKDVYSYSLSASGIIGATTISTTEDDFIGLMTDYMNGKTDEFALMENSEFDPEPIFSALDQQAMAGARSVLWAMLVIGIVALVLSAAAYFLMVRWRVKDIFMKRFNACVWVFIALELINIVTVCVPKIRMMTWGRLIPMEFPDGDNLVILLGDAFPRQVVMFETIAAVVVMIAAGYLTRSIAGRRKMFRRV